MYCDSDVNDNPKSIGGYLITLEGLLGSMFPLVWNGSVATLTGCSSGECESLSWGKAAREAMRTAQQTFVSGGGVSDGLPRTEVSTDEAYGMDMITALKKVGFAASNGEARRLIRGGGARLNDAQINDESKILSPDDFIDGKVKISAGKKRHAILVLG